MPPPFSGGEADQPGRPVDARSAQGSAEKLRAWMDLELAHLPQFLPRMVPGDGEAAWPIGLAKPAARVKEPV